MVIGNFAEKVASSAKKTSSTAVAPKLMLTRTLMILGLNGGAGE
jgi:hypothetical protein